MIGDLKWSLGAFSGWCGRSPPIVTPLSCSAWSIAVGLPGRGPARTNCSTSPEEASLSVTTGLFPLEGAQLASTKLLP